MTATGSTPTASGTAATPATTAPAAATPAAATPAAATPAAATAPVAVGLIGAGAIGTFHGETLARRLPGARLAGVADPSPGAAERLAGRLGAGHATTDPAALLADPAVEAVVIAAPARAHADLVQAAARAGKAVFCEKPMAVTLADAARAAAAARAAGVPLQVGFNRRFDRSFRAAHDLVATGGVGTPQLLRSLTRDPGLADRPGSPRGPSSSRRSSTTSTRCAT